MKLKLQETECVTFMSKNKECSQDIGAHIS
jgi:hypothetical protein